MSRSPEDGKLLEFTADRRGIADLHLKPGEYQYRIAYPAFCPKSGTTTIDPIWPQEIRAKLDVRACPGSCEPSCVTPIGVEPSGYPVAIKVIDSMGTLVSGAVVEIDYSPSLGVVKTDNNGRAAFGLPIGTHSVTVSAPGFNLWKGFAKVQGTLEVITPKLRIAGTADPEISSEPPGIDVPLYVRELGNIDLQPLETVPLPGVSLGRHSPRH